MRLADHISRLTTYRKWIFVVLMGLVIFLLYWPVFNGQFLLDDFSSIVRNRAIRSLDISRIYAFSPARFLGYLSFAINFYFSKLNPVSYYLVNICIHVLFSTQVFLFIQALWQTPSGKNGTFSDNEKQGIAMATALLIAVHPMSCFAVSYIVQRLASLTALFFLLSLYFYITARVSGTAVQRAIRFGLCGVFGVFALFTKQNAFTLFPVILLTELFCFDLTRRKLIGFLAGLAVMGIIFLGLTGLDLLDLNELRRLTYETRQIDRYLYFINQLAVVCFYLSQIVFPNRLAVDYKPVIHDSFFHPHIFISALILAGILGLAIFFRTRKQTRLAGYGILFYFATLSIESSIFPIRDLMFIHRTYLPNAGMVFAIVFLGYILIQAWRRSALIPITLLSVIVAGAMALTVHCNLMFQTPLAVWQRVVDISPKHARGYAHIGMIQISKKEYDAAEQNLLKAVSLDLREIKILNNLGVVYSKTGQYEKAIKMYKYILQLKRNYIQAHVNLANTYADMGNYPLAIKTYRQALRYNPNNFETLLNLGKHLALGPDAGTGQLNEALALLDRARAINDAHPVLYYARGIAFLRLNRPEPARKNLNQALAINPGFEAAQNALGTLEPQ